MTRKELSTKYNLIGENKDLVLFRKSGEFTEGIGYCGNITLKRGKIIFNNNGYTDLNSLDNALIEWEHSLPYPVDTYCPMTRKCSCTQNRIVWYLRTKFGFEVNKSTWDANSYIRNIGPNSCLEFNIKTDLNDESVIITSSFGGAIFTQSVDNAEDGIDVIDSIINGSILMMAKDIVDVISACGENITDKINAFIPTNQNILGIRQVSFKELMISRLENILIQLKEM